MRSRHLLNPDVEGLGTSATLAINERCKALARDGRKVFKLGLGQSPFPVEATVVEALRRHAPEKDYLPVEGLPALREAVARYHRREDRLDARAERVLIGPGSKELIFLTQLAFGGEILIPAPSWVSYSPQARILGRRPRWFEVGYEDGWKITPERLDRVCRDGAAAPSLLILNYPNNPVGNTYSAAELADLAGTARRHGLLILSDEIYGRLDFSGQHTSIARFYPEGTIVSSGLSKWCGAGGWRLGTFTFPEPLEDLSRALAAIASETFTSVSAPIQHAAVTAFAGGPAIDRYLADSRRILAALGRRCAAVLRSAGARVPEPAGGFYLFADFSPFAKGLAGRGIHDGSAFCERLLEDTGVAILPGLPFGRPAEELTARLSYVDFDGAAALAELADVPLDADLPADFLERRCARVLEAVERIVGWLGEHDPQETPERAAQGAGLG